MRQSLKGAFLTVLFAGLVLLFAPATTLADASFTLHIPDRGVSTNNVPVGAIKMVLDLASDPSLVTTQVTVGSKTINLNNGDELNAPFTGDQIAFIQIPGTNKVTILYEPFGIFNAAENRCVGKTDVGIYPRAPVIDFKGPAILAFRMNTFTVAKTLNTDPGPCGNAFRRVKSNAATITAGGGVFTPLDLSLFKGRLPLDVVLVLDKSGSMLSLPVGAPAGFTKSRWQVLRETVEQFVNLWVQADDSPIPPGGALPIDVPQDRIAVVFFSTTKETVPLDGTAFFAQRGANGSVSWMPVKNSFNTRSPGGSTGMGQALIEALTIYKTDETPPAAKNDASIVLVTDGLQNDPLPKIEPDMVTSLMKIAGLGAPMCLSAALADCGVPIHTVAMGVPVTNSDEDKLLSNIAQQTTGKTKIAETPVETNSSLPDLLVEALKGNTLSLLTRNHGTLTTPASAPVPFLLDGSVLRATFVLSWDGPATASDLDLEITRPDGQVVAPVVKQFGAQSVVASVDIPKSGPVGDWSVRVVRTIVPGSLPRPRVGAPADTAAGTSDFRGDLFRNVALRPEPGAAPRRAAQGLSTPYRLSIYTVEGKLDYRLSLPTVNDGTGDTMRLTADVTYEGKPLTGLPANAITLRIERPPVALGTKLHDTPVKAEVLTTETASGGDTTTPYERKVEALAKDGALNDTRPQDLGTNFVLRDDGSAASGDARASDSVYTARFADTSRPGLYRFNVVLDWNDPRTGHIRRVETVERVVRVTPDTGASLVAATNEGGGVYVIRVTPRDKFQNYYGPSSGNPIRVNVTGGGSVESIRDSQQTGDYLVRITGVPPGANPHVVISVDGTKIRDTKIASLPGGSSVGGGSTPESKFAIFFHGGANFPHGNFNNLWETGFSFNAGLEYAATDYFSVEGIFGYHRFGGKTIGPVSISDLNTFQFSGNGKVYLSPPGAVRPWANFGIGAYKFDPGSTRFGGNVGGGLQFNVTPKAALEGAYNFHAVTSFSGSDRKFSTLQGGVRFRF